MNVSSTSQMVTTTSYSQVDTAIPKETSYISNPAAWVFSASSLLSSNAETSTRATISSVSVGIISSIGALSSQTSASVAFTSTSSPIITPTISSLSAASSPTVSSLLPTDLTTSDTELSMPPSTSSLSSSSNVFTVIMVADEDRDDRKEVDERKDPIEERPTVVAVRDTRPPIIPLSYESVDYNQLRINNFSEWGKITYRVVKDLKTACEHYQADKAREENKVENPGLSRLINTPALQNMETLRGQLRTLRLRLVLDFKISNPKIVGLLDQFEEKLFRFLLCSYYESVLGDLLVLINQVEAWNPDKMS